MMSKGKILVVDDNSGIRAALKILLPKYFNAVELLASPAAIHACLRDFRPDVVLLDMNFETDTNTGNEDYSGFRKSSGSVHRPRWYFLLLMRILPWRWKE